MSLLSILLSCLCLSCWFLLCSLSTPWLLILLTWLTFGTSSVTIPRAKLGAPWAATLSPFCLRVWSYPPSPTSLFSGCVPCPIVWTVCPPRPFVYPLLLINSIPPVHSASGSSLDKPWQEHLCDCLWVAQPELQLELNQTYLERSDNGCLPTVPIQSDRVWDDLQRRMTQNPLIQGYLSYPNRFEASAKGASTQYWVKGLNTYAMWYFSLFFFLSYK